MSSPYGNFVPRPGTTLLNRISSGLDLAVIESILATKVIGRAERAANELWAEVDSTNSRAALLARQGASEGVIVLADHQTAGRGRLGRTWVSPPGTGLCMSVILRPKVLSTDLSLVTLAAGVAVTRAVEITTGVTLGLKWVNDLIIDGGKIGGILAELQKESRHQESEPASTNTFDQALILGIGINICKGNTEPPEEIRDKIRWLEEITHQPVDRNQLVSQIAFELEQVLAVLSAGEVTTILDAWRKHSVTLGESIKTQMAQETITGLAININNNGALVVQTLSGTRELHAGEVSIRKSDGSYF